MNSLYLLRNTYLQYSNAIERTCWRKGQQDYLITLNASIDDHGLFESFFLPSTLMVNFIVCSYEQSVHVTWYIFSITKLTKGTTMLCNNLECSYWWPWVVWNTALKYFQQAQCRSRANKENRRLRQQKFSFPFSFLFKKGVVIKIPFDIWWLKRF